MKLFRGGQCEVTIINIINSGHDVVAATHPFLFLCLHFAEGKFSNSVLFFQAEFHLKGEYNPALKKKKKNKKKKAGKGQEKYVITAIVLILWRSIC